MSGRAHITPAKLRRSKRIAERKYREKGIIAYNNWVSATSTRNYMLRDPLVDWLNFTGNVIVGDNIAGGNDNVTGGVATSIIKFITEKGVEFENAVMRIIQQRIDFITVDVTVDITVKKRVSDAISVDKYNETIRLMKQGVPIIYQGVLHNNAEGPFWNTYGVPDLIIRSDYINRLVDDKAIDDNDAAIAAPKLSGNYHYRVIDIKFATLHLHANGRTLLNIGNAKCYKSQLIVYNKALGQMQGYEPSECYVLGRGYQYTCRGVKYSSNKCTSRLAQVDLAGVDKDCITATQLAIEWRRRLLDEGSQWQVLPRPSTRELYPNMCNRMDGAQHANKRAIAEQLADITMVWQCGPKHRDRCFDSGVCSWSDPLCTAELLGFKRGSKRYDVVQAMLQFNQGILAADANIFPVSIDKNKQWLRPAPLEFYVDFECVNNIDDNFQCLPEIGGSNHIFMIGVGYVLGGNGAWTYKCFYANSLDDASERDLVNAFLDYIDEISARYGAASPLYHWGTAEPKFLERYFNKQPHQRPAPRFVDALSIIRSEPIIVRGVFGFDLKGYARGLSNYGFIQNRWDSHMNGPDAMITAMECYARANLATDPKFQNIIKYNEADCQTVYDIVNFLRLYYR